MFFEYTIMLQKKCVTSEFIRNLNQLQWYHHILLLPRYCHPLLFQERYSCLSLFLKVFCKPHCQASSCQFWQKMVSAGRWKWAYCADKFSVTHELTRVTLQQGWAVPYSRSAHSHTLRSHVLLWMCYCSTYCISFKATGSKKGFSC